MEEAERRRRHAVRLRPGAPADGAKLGSTGSPQLANLGATPCGGGALEHDLLSDHHGCRGVVGQGVHRGLLLVVIRCSVTSSVSRPGRSGIRQSS
jgi:hypothetical protein